MEDSIMSETRRDVSNLMEFDIKGSGHFVRIYSDKARNIHIYRRTLPRDGGECIEVVSLKGEGNKYYPCSEYFGYDNSAVCLSTKDYWLKEKLAWFMTNGIVRCEQKDLIAIREGWRQSEAKNEVESPEETDPIDELAAAVDVCEISFDDDIVNILKQERTTGKQLKVKLPVLPRYMKARLDQRERTKAKAEVFTPVSIVKEMNDLVNKHCEEDYNDYIDSRVLEVCCGEAPFLTSRYDAATGEWVEIKDRVGLLDRKLQHIPEDVDKDIWVELATRALKASYGYEWQEDSIYLARENLLMNVIEHYVDKFGLYPKHSTVREWAEIVSYNIFRMDGLTLCIPETSKKAKVMNWETGKIEHFDGTPIKNKKKRSAIAA